MTNQGPQRTWLWGIGKPEGPFCACGTIQNAAHLLEYKLVGDDKGRLWVGALKGQKWYREVWAWVQRNVEGWEISLSHCDILSQRRAQKLNDPARPLLGVVWLAQASRRDTRGCVFSSWSI